MSPNGDVLALHLEIDRVAEPEQRPRRLVGPIADEHASRRRPGLKPGGDVDGIAGRHRSVGEDLAGSEDLAGVDPDPDREGHAEAALEVLGQGSEPVGDLGRRTDCPCGIVLADPWHAEHGHDRVADVFLDRAAPGLDGRGGQREVVTEDRADALGIEPLAERGRIGEVHEHGRDQFSLVRGDGAIDRLAADGTEPSVGRDRRSAALASDLERGTALGAEPCVVAVLRSARSTCHAHRASVRSLARRDRHVPEMRSGARGKGAASLAVDRPGRASCRARSEPLSPLCKAPDRSVPPT